MAERKTQYNRVKRSKPLPDSVELEALKDSEKVEEPKRETKKEEPKVASELAKPIKLQVLAVSGLNVRKQPSKGAPIFKVLKNKTVFLANKVENGWAYISELDGWVMTEFTSYKKK